ncbi:hypothetical protein PybrP1_001368 [[Pythium] brassicae (nom. inval.)]|nr:hypothetical protein PybrP1_001368 [[Pythium] brassicae (nom. inval.)]
MDATRLPVKLSCADETHRAALIGDPPSFDALCALVAATFPQAAPPASFALVYTDDEGDLVTLASALELAEARRVFQAQGRTLHVRVLPRVAAKDQLPPAVLLAVDELSSTLARLASGTRESLAQSAFLERSRASVAYSAKQTCEFFESARKEIAQRLRDVHARIAGEIERRRSSAAAMDAAPAAEPEDVGVEMETRHSEQRSGEREEEQAAVSGDSDDDDDEVTATETQAMEAVEEIAVGLRQQDQHQPPHEEEMMDESDAETVACSSSDEDDDDDDEAANGSDVEWAVVPDVWNAEVTLVRTILPHVHVDDCVAALRQHGGNLEAAINELTGP